jgi:hypothetical protein
LSLETLEDRLSLTADPMAVYLNGQASDHTAGTLVDNLYRETLGREANAAERNFWTDTYKQALTIGTPFTAQETLVAEFLDSGEYRAHLIQGIYHRFN